MIIEPLLNVHLYLVLNKISSNITYQNFFNIEYLHLYQLFNEKNSIKNKLFL